MARVKCIGIRETLTSLLPEADLELIFKELKSPCRTCRRARYGAGRKARKRDGRELSAQGVDGRIWTGLLSENSCRRKRPAITEPENEPMIRAICRAVVGVFMDFAAALVVIINASQIASVKFRSVVPSSVVSVFGIFLIMGVVVLFDYGISSDEPIQRYLANLTADYIVGNNDVLLQLNELKNYGVAFEMLLLFVERIFSLEDSRSIYLTRHILIHLFFLLGGLICYFLAYRLFNNRFLAVLAMLLFLLHPRMYGHSFFNSKDIPFLSMFMISLFLIFRGFRKDTIGAFILCGTGIGILTNIRIIGVMLFAAVLAMRVCDYFFASGREEKKHILVTGGGGGGELLLYLLCMPLGLIYGVILSVILLNRLQ